MSIFSRLFNKGQDDEEKPAEEGEAPAEITPVAGRVAHDRPSPSGARAKLDAPATRPRAGHAPLPPLPVPPPSSRSVAGAPPPSRGVPSRRGVAARGPMDEPGRPAGPATPGDVDEDEATRVSAPLQHDMIMAVAALAKKPATPETSPAPVESSPDDTTRRRPTGPATQVQGRINLMAIAKGGSTSGAPAGSPKPPAARAPVPAPSHAKTPAVARPGMTPPSGPASPAGATPEAPPIVATHVQNDPSDVRALYAELAANYMRPVREFIAELAVKPAQRSWLEVCEPAIKSLRRSSDGMELSDLSSALDVFGKALSDASRAGGDFIDGPHRDAILAAHAKLVSSLPQAFALEPRETDAQAAQREAMVVHSVLLQVPGVTRMAVDKLYAAGLASLDALYSANADDMSMVTGVSREVAARIVAKVASFRTERESGRAASRAAERDELARAVAALKQSHVAYERVADGWTDEAAAQKRELRKSRAETLLKIKVLLARWGELERVHEIERLSFERKLEKLERYLKESAKER